jgi:flagellar hook-associated protein 2
MSTSSTSSSTLFNGTSRFSSDLQQVLTRAINIASLPITQLNGEVATLQGQATELNSVQSSFASLNSAIQQLNSATGLSSLNSSVSDPSILSANLSGSAAPGTYTIEVTNLGSSTNTLSDAPATVVTDPSSQSISPSSSFTLTIDGTATAIKPQTNTLEGLVQAVNNQPGLNVQASIVNVGSSSSPDYRLTIQSQKLGPVAIQLNDGTSDLLNTLNSGALAEYKVDGLATPITSDSRTVTLAPGFTVHLLSQSPASSPTTISVTQNSTGIQNALSSLVSAYNSAVDGIDKSVGQNAGALQGQSLIYSLKNTLRSLTSYANGATPGLSSLTDLGITFDKSGHLSLDSTTFASATSSQVSALIGFLGGSTSGGFLKSATDLLSSASDSTNGAIANALTAVQNEIANENGQISAQQTRVDALQTSLTSQIASADALIAGLEQTYTQVSGLFQAFYQSNSNSSTL